MRVIITENQFKSIIEQATKPKPANQTYTLVKDRILTKNTDSTPNTKKLVRGLLFTHVKNAFIILFMLYN